VSPRAVMLPIVPELNGPAHARKLIPHALRAGPRHNSNSCPAYIGAAKRGRFGLGSDLGVQTCVLVA
jgi:hypothetical protein